jgi:hypothetical protein
MIGFILSCPRRMLVLSVSNFGRGFISKDNIIPVKVVRMILFQEGYPLCSANVIKKNLPPRPWRAILLFV